MYMFDENDYILCCWGGLVYVKEKKELLISSGYFRCISHFEDYKFLVGRYDNDEVQMVDMSTRTITHTIHKFSQSVY